MEVRNWLLAGEQVLTYPHPAVKLLNGTTPAVATYLHRDGLSSVRAIANAAGAKIEAALYKPFGEQSEWLLPGNAAPETKGWIGERYDADAGLQYLNARYYDPELGLFLQPDWFEVTKAGVGTNRFSYSFNDPVNKFDPGGNQNFDSAGLAGWEATQDKDERDKVYKENAETHSNLAKKFREEEGPDDVIKYHEDAAAYYSARIGTSTADLVAEAATELGYAAIGVRYGATVVVDVPPGSYRSIHELNVAETQAILDDVARNAAKTVGVGKGPVYGSRVHSEFKKGAEACGFSCEVSYRKGEIVPHGTKGSVRLDAVDNPLSPTIVADLKTGSATLSPARIREILSHLPQGSNPIMFEVRP